MWLILSKRTINLVKFIKVQRWYWNFSLWKGIYLKTILESAKLNIEKIFQLLNLKLSFPPTIWKCILSLPPTNSLRSVCQTPQTLNGSEWRVAKQNYSITTDLSHRNVNVGMDIRFLFVQSVFCLFFLNNHKNVQVPLFLRAL